MRRLSGITAVTLCAVLVAVGCDALSIGLTDDCDYMLTCAHHDWLNGEGGGPPDPACEADPTKDASTVSDACAVFASASAAPGGDGTKAKPYVSLAEAVAKANGKRVLACTSEPFTESVTIEAGLEVIGGFDCEAEWTWGQEARSAIEGPVGAVVLTLGEGASGAKVRSFSIRAASATEPGGSSIGVAVADIEAELAQVDVTAGDGMEGANGEMPTEALQAGASASEVVSEACEVVYGGEPGVTMCQDGETRGGAGGLGGTTGTDEGNGQKGADGAPLPEPNPNNKGLGGVGQTDAAGECEVGENGKSGDPGGAGEAGSDTQLTLNRIAGGDGGSGTSGKRGQGGGGGGGAKAGLFCGPVANPLDGPGASGGGGGAGGCGGKGGGGGKAGGSSLGIVSLGTKLVLTEVTVEVGKAGKGGDGVVGQSGANGGAGGPGGDASGVSPSMRGCDGGRGGAGGPGGPGGGGRGGHAVGIAYAAAPSAAVALENFMAGTPGDGGSAGPGGSEQNAGVPGASGACWDFSIKANCGQ
ncbi:hypothetical protein [Sorangium sp. So ce1151]|uniref:hypothetical protein n=1 Tax=Sorangium sp. So ce1151 TaxID=3133332 RepID=UPI003F6057BB